MTAKDFLELQVIPSISKLVENDPFIAFTIMAISIEFLGKGTKIEHEWGQEKGNYQDDFKAGLVRCNI